MEFIERIIHAITITHPTHPMLVHFPIALTGASSLFIFLALWRKNVILEQAAYANIVLAMLGTIAAGITGLLDNQNAYDGSAPNAGLKIVLAILLLVITATISFVRWRNPLLFHSRAKFLYIIAYFVSFVIALILAFLGGVILYGF